VATFNALPDSDQTDGEQTVTFIDPDAAATITVDLTGLTNAQDSGVFNEASFLSTFGADSLLL
jgi:hypothetical protein